MLLAESKKQTNISEYIVYMYQTEDLLRAYTFDMEKVEAHVIHHIPLEDKAEILHWYKEIAATMIREGIENGGHLASVQQLVDELEALKDRLLTSDSEFKHVYEKSYPHIAKSLELAQGKIKGEVQVCINGVYGLLLLRMNGKSVHPDLMPSVNAFGDVLSYLSYTYKQQGFMQDN